MCLAYPMQIKEVKKNTAVAEVDGIKKEISIMLLPQVKKGDYVMVHAGFAIEKVSAKEAAKTLEVFKEYNNALRKGPAQ